MKCEVCLQLLEEYLDSELLEPEAEQVSAHLITCASCANEFEVLTAEQEIYARYDRALDIAPSMWGTIAARSAADSQVFDLSPRFRWRERVAGLFAAPSFGVSFAGAMAVLIVAAAIGMTYLRAHRQIAKPDVTVKVRQVEPARPSDPRSVNAPPLESDDTAALGSDHFAVKTLVKASPKSKSSFPGNAGADQSDVLNPDAAYSAVEEQDTQKHIEQAQNLLRSIRNIEVNDDDAEIDVSYEKALSRQLLNENVVLRRDAEMSGKFPVKTLLSSLEPFLLDIANLPDKTSPDDLRVIKERVQETEIVAALQSY